MRLVFLLLVLANLVFYVWANYLASPADGHEPQRMAAQKFPEKLRIVPPEATPPAPEGGDTFCQAVDALDTTVAEQLKASVEKISGVSASIVAADLPPRFAVTIGPLVDRAAAEVKRTEVLKMVGAAPALRIEAAEDGKISLVLKEFDNPPAAEACRQELVGKGVKSAQVAPLPAKPATNVRLEISGNLSLLPQLQPLLAKAGAAAADCSGR